MDSHSSGGVNSSQSVTSPLPCPGSTPPTNPEALRPLMTRGPFSVNTWEDKRERWRETRDGVSSR